MSMNRLIEKMRTGDRESIVEGLFHRGGIFRMDAIGYSAIFHLSDEEIAKRIVQLKEDPVWLDGYSVSDFACAALDVMGIEPYAGDSAAVKRLIESKFEFLK